MHPIDSPLQTMLALFVYFRIPQTCEIMCMRLYNYSLQFFKKYYKKTDIMIVCALIYIKMSYDESTYIIDIPTWIGYDAKKIYALEKDLIIKSWKML